MNKSLHAVASPGHFARTSLAGLILCSMMFSSAVPAVSFARQGRQTRETTPPITNNEQAANERTISKRDDATALYQALLDLQNPWTVMCVAAHPDDEDGATLTILRRKYGAHTVSLFSTYGEGGQNAVGPELYEELGAIRARETAEAATVQGSEPHFLALRDFGFSKSADEAFRVWNHDEALRRMVYQIRLLRPDVIITNHDTVSGHGHHQATGRLVLEAFDAAADPARFPEQLRGSDKETRVSTWQVQRLFVRAGFDGGAGSKQPGDEASRANTIISYDANERDPVRGTTYAEQALEALRHHATQGPWPRSVPAGARIIRYRLVRSAKDAAAFPAHAQTFLDGLQLPEQVAAKLAPPKFGNRPLTDFINERQRVFYALAGAQI
ncbi:MAG: PIG-L deacetylase family protein, partial [Pyrinomonadaceae bacterium]